MVRSDACASAVLLAAAAALAIVQPCAADYENYDVEALWQNRRRAQDFSIGPAPFPDHSQMDWELYGSAFARSNCIEVTKAEPGLKGAVWGRKPNVQYAKEWQAEFNFRVGGGPNEANRFGDGFALWYITDRGVGGGALGGPDFWTGLGIFFDTYKNVHYRNKKHPLIYGIVNDGKTDYKDVKDKDISDHSCHVPFRGSDPANLEETIARVTYKDNILSVVMQPLGAVDWVKCFEMKDVTLPSGGYFGVTAMTGQLVDEHQMVKFDLYHNIETQPFEYAHDNVVHEMPEMWRDMRESGTEARNYMDLRFREEAKLFGDEFDFDPSHPDYSDYADEGFGEDFDPYYGEGAEDGEPKPHGGRRGRGSGRGRGGRDLSFEVDPDSRRDIERVFAHSPALQEVIAEHELQNKKIKQLFGHMEAEIQEMTDIVQHALHRVRSKESELNMRLAKISQKYHVTYISPFYSHVEASKRGWLWPFIFVFVGLLGFAATGYSKYKRFMKTHLL